MPDSMLARMATRVAAALVDSPVPDNFSMDDVNGWTEEKAYEVAKAALQAIREPSDALIEAAYETRHEPWEPPYLGDVHKSIIDAILSGEV